jgi:hypothetical protein
MAPRLFKRQRGGLIMKSIHSFRLTALAFASLLALARPGYGGGHVYHGYYGGHGYHYAGHGHYYGYGYRPYYRHYPYYYRHYPYYYGPGSYTSFGFGFGGGYAPPVYVTPPPTVIYESPTVVEEQPAVADSQHTEVEPPQVDQPADGAQGSPNDAGHGFVETRREYHHHGSNSGQLDWVEGYMDGRPVRIYYDDSGRVKKQKWLD